MQLHHQVDSSGTAGHLALHGRKVATHNTSPGIACSTCQLKLSTGINRAMPNGGTHAFHPRTAPRWPADCGSPGTIADSTCSGNVCRRLALEHRICNGPAQASRRRPQMLGAHEHSGAFSNKMLTRKYLFSHLVRKEVFSKFLIRVWLHGFPLHPYGTRKAPSGYNRTLVPTQGQGCPALAVATRILFGP